MIKKIIFMVALTLATNSIANEGATYGWKTTKKHLKVNALRHGLRTIYAGCRITVNYKVDFKSCNFTYALSNTHYADNDYGNIDAEHLVPSSRLMRHAGCGIYTRSECRKHNSEFKYCHNQLMNLAPSISVINRFRGKLPFTELPTGSYYYPFGEAIGFKKALDGTSVEPPDRAKNRVSRAYLYMNEIGCINLTIEEMFMYTRWYLTY